MTAAVGTTPAGPAAGQNWDVAGRQLTAEEVAHLLQASLGPAASTPTPPVPPPPTWSRLRRLVAAACDDGLVVGHLRPEPQIWWRDERTEWDVTRTGMAFLACGLAYWSDERDHTGRRLLRLTNAGRDWLTNRGDPR